MKYIYLILLFTISSFAQNTLSVAVHPSAHPYGWHNNNKIEGAAYDLIEQIAKDLNFKIKPIIVPWARAVEETKSGNIDMILTAFYTKERAKMISYLEYYDKSETSVFVSKDSNITFKKWEDLIGFTGLTIVGDSQGDKWDKFEQKHLNVLRVVNIKQVFKMIANQRADYAVFPKLATLRETTELRYENQIVALPTPVTSQGIYFGLSKKSKFQKLIPKINAKIKEYKKNGFYKKLRDKAYDSLEKSHL